MSTSCATTRCCFGMEVRDLLAWSPWRPAETGGSLTRRRWEGWEQPRSSQGGSALLDTPCLVSETGRCAR